MSDITLRGVTKRHGTVAALDDLSCTIESGSFAVVIGPSGCGKSTLLRVIAGLDSIDQGDIYFDNVSAGGLPTRERGCAMVFQDYALYPHMTVRGNIEYPLKLGGMKGSDRAERVDEVSELLDIKALLNRRPAQLSGGQRQRAAIGRAIAKRPKILLLDEPLSNLDTRLRADTRAEFQRLHRQLDMTIVYVTHDYVEAMTLADEIHVMEGGRIVQSGGSDTIYGRPATMDIARSFGSPRINLFAATVAAERQFVTRGGQSIACPGLSFDIGTELVVGARPESVFLSDRPAVSTFDLLDIEDRGSAKVFRGMMGDDELRVWTQSRSSSSKRRDDALFLDFDVSELIFFDAGTGELISTATDSPMTAWRAEDSRRILVPRSPLHLSGHLGGDKPDCIGRKFLQDGEPRPYAGNTLLFEIGQSHALSGPLCDLSMQLQQSAGARYFSFLPRDTFHITLLDGIEFENIDRSTLENRGLVGLSGDDISERFQLALSTYEGPGPVRVRPVRVSSNRSGGLLLYVEGFSKSDEMKLRQTRDEVSELLGIRREGHDRYLFHVTLAYQLDWLPDEEAGDLFAECQRLSKDIVRSMPYFEIANARFAVYTDMLNYDTSNTLVDRP